MLSRAAGHLKRASLVRTQKRSAQVKAPRRPSMEKLKQKYGDKAHLFYKDLHPQLKYFDAYDKHKQRVEFSYVDEFQPHVDLQTFVAPNATLAGNVEVWARSSIWYGVTIRADTKLIRIGDTTNIQDNTTITEALGPLHADHDGSTIVGHNVTVGHSCHLSACTIEDNCYVGMQSVLAPDSYMEEGSMLAAKSVLATGSRVPSGELWGGSPARKLRNLTEEELTGIKDGALRYWKIANEHIDEFYLPIGTNYIEAEKIDPDIGYSIYDEDSTTSKAL